MENNKKIVPWLIYIYIYDMLIVWFRYVFLTLELCAIVLLFYFFIFFYFIFMGTIVLLLLYRLSIMFSIPVLLSCAPWCYCCFTDCQMWFCVYVLTSITHFDILWFMDLPFRVDEILGITEERGVESKSVGFVSDT